MESWLIAIIILLLILVIILVVNKEESVISNKEEKELIKQSEDLQMKEEGLRVGIVTNIEFMNPILDSEHFYNVKYTIGTEDKTEDTLISSTINHKSNGVKVGSKIEYYKYNKHVYIRLTSKKGKTVKTKEEKGKVIKVHNQGA